MKDGIWTVQNLLSREECQKIVSDATEEGIHNKRATGDVRHRNCFSHYFQDAQMAQNMWERFESLEFLPFYSFKNCDDDDEPLPAGFQRESVRDLSGQWNPTSINKNFTLLYYEAGGHFGPHRDNYKILSDHERSMLTVATYLTDRPEGSGGGTQFVRDDMDVPMADQNNRIIAKEEDVELQVSSNEAGKSLIFQHDFLHQGQALLPSKPKTVTMLDEKKNEEEEEEDLSEPPPLPPPKWLLITQVVYTRDVESAPSWTDEQYEARRVLQEAEDAEVAGDIPKAIRLYRRAYKLDPSLES